MKSLIVLTACVLGMVGTAPKASASLFDTLESVDVLQKIAAQNLKQPKDPLQPSTDRLPAGKDSDSATTGKSETSEN